MPLFELRRRHPIVISMASDWIVKKFDVIEDLSLRFVTCFIDFALNPLSLQQREEALSYGVVMAATPARHAELSAVGAHLAAR